MASQFSRRTLVKGAAGAAAGAAGASALALGPKRSSVYSAPNLVQDVGAPVEVTYWTAFGSGVNGEAQTALVEGFNESQDDIVIVAHPLESYEEIAAQLISGLQTGDIPDLAVISDVWWFRFYLAGALEDLNPYLTDEIDPGDYVEPLFVEYERAGGQWGLPFARSTPLFYYNAEALDASGLSPEIFETWSSFREAAPDLIAGSDVNAAMGFGSAADYGAWVLQPAVWAFGGRYSDDDFNMMLTEPEALEAGEFMREFVESGNATAVAELQTDFVNGLFGAALFSTGSLGNITETANFEFATAFLPEEVQFGCSTGGAGLSIMADASDEAKDAAFQFMDYCTNVENTTTWSQTTGYMPVRTSAIESEEMQAYLDENPNSQVALEQLPLTQLQDPARAFVPNGDQIIGQGWEQILVNLVPAEEAFAEVEAELELEAAPMLEQIEALEG